MFTKNEINKRYRTKNRAKLLLWDRNYSRTISGFFSTVYASIRRNCRTRNHPYPTFTKKELIVWCIRQNKFSILFGMWEASGYLSDLKPSIDRLDNTKSYTLDNIQLTTWHENMLAGNKEKRIRVSKFDLDGRVCATYVSMSHAARDNKIDIRLISAVVLGKRKTTHGYIWRKF